MIMIKYGSYKLLGTHTKRHGTSLVIIPWVIPYGMQLNKVLSTSSIC